MFAFQKYNEIMNKYILPLMKFSGVYVSADNGRIYPYGQGATSQNPPLEIDDKVAIWPKNNGMYIATVESGDNDFELFDPFRREIHMSVIAFATVARLNPFFCEDEEFYDPSEFWVDMDTAPLILEVFRGENYVYQIIEKSTGEAIAEGEHEDKRFALFLLCIDALKEYGNRPQIEFANSILEDVESSLTKLEKNYNTFNNKLKDLRGESRYIKGIDLSDEDEDVRELYPIEDFTFTPFKNEVELQASGFGEPGDIESICNLCGIENEQEKFDEGEPSVGIDSILEPDYPVWDNDAIERRYQKEGLIGFDEDLDIFQ